MADIRNKTKRVFFPKHILQFWSGGADSTYLLLQNLLCKNRLTLTYLDVQNNGKKTEREVIARDSLKEDIAKFCDHFHLTQPMYLEDHHIRINHEVQSCGAPQQIMFLMTALLIGRKYDEIQLGIVFGDSMRGSNYYNKIVAIHRRFFCKDFPDITYPIENMSKETIYLALKGYDKLLGTNFIKNLTVCESIDKPCGKDKQCNPCQTQAAVFKRLRWTK